MRKGKVVECGTHEELYANESYYHELIKSQMQVDHYEEQELEKSKFEEEEKPK